MPDAPPPPPPPAPVVSTVHRIGGGLASPDPATMVCAPSADGVGTRIESTEDSGFWIEIRITRERDLVVCYRMEGEFGGDEAMRFRIQRTPTHLLIVSRGSTDEYVLELSPW